MIVQIPLYKAELEILKVDEIHEPYSHFAAITEEIDFHTYRITFGKVVTEGIIAHEALHVISAIFSNRMIELSFDHDEHLCYLLEWIVDRCHEALKQAACVGELSSPL